MLKSDTDSYNYSTIDESIASTESTLRYCLWKKGTQFTYDIPDGLIEGDCVEVKGRLTGKRVCLELSGALTKVPSTAAADGDAEKVEEHRVVPLRLRFSRGGRYKLHSDYLGREASRRGRFRYDFQADSQFIVQIRILHLYYDIRINDIELIKLEHGQLHNEIQMLSLDGDAEFTAVDFIDLEDLAEATGGGLAISLPMGDPIDNSSPASEPELIVPKKFRKQNAQQPVLDTIDTAGTMDYADGRAAHQQQRTKRRTEEPTSEMPAGVKARKTKLPSSSSKENDAHPELTVDSAEQRLELKDSSTSEARRSRDRRPKGLANNDKLMVAELPIQSDKQPKQSTGEPRRSKRTSDQQQTLQQGNKAELGFDIKDSESKQERSQRKKTTKSPRTSSNASNYSTSEVAYLGVIETSDYSSTRDPTHRTKTGKSPRELLKASNSSNSEAADSINTDSKQQRRQRRTAGSKERQHREQRQQSDSPGLMSNQTEERQKNLSEEEYCKVEAQQPQSMLPIYQQTDEQHKDAETTKRRKLAQEDETKELHQSRSEQPSKRETSSNQYSKSKPDARRPRQEQDFAQNGSQPRAESVTTQAPISSVLAEQQELQNAESVKTKEMQPRTQQQQPEEATIFKTEKPTANQIRSPSAKLDRPTLERNLQQPVDSLTDPSKSVSRPKSLDVEQNSSKDAAQPVIKKPNSLKSQPQKLDSPKTGTDPHHQKEHSAPPGSDHVDTKPNRQKLDTSKAQKQQIPAGSYSVPTPTLQQQQQRRPQGQSSLGRPRRGSGAGEAEVLPPSAPSQQQQQQKQPHNVQSFPPVKSALPKAPNKQRLGESRADTEIQSQDAPAPGSYSSPRAQQQKLKRADVEPQHELEISGSYNIEAQQSAVKQKSHQQRLGEDLRQQGAKSSSRRRGSAGEKKASALDGVYRVVPVTPVVSALPVANQQQQQQILLKQKQLKQQSQQRQESAGEMSDSLWKSQHIDEDNLVSLTDSQLDSADCPSAAADQDVAPKSNRSSSRKSSSGLSSVAEANADAAGPCSAADLTQQYMYYAADESSTSPSAPAAAAAAAAVSSPIEVARDASEFFVEPQPQHQLMQQQPSSLDAVKRLDISGPWSIQERRKVPPSNDTFDEDGSSQTAADQAFRHSTTPSELLYAESKVYDTITVEPTPAKVSGLQATSVTTSTNQPQTSTPTNQDDYNLEVATAAAAGASASSAVERNESQRSALSDQPTSLELPRKKSQSAEQQQQQQHHQQQQHLHLFCRSQSYSLERAQHKIRGSGAYPEAMSDGIYRPLTQSNESLSLPAALPVEPGSKTPKTPSLRSVETGGRAESRTTDQMATVARAESATSATSKKSKSKSVEHLDGASDTDSVWMADFSFHDRLARSSSSVSQRQAAPSSADRRRQQARRDLNDNGGFILTAQLPTTVQQANSSSELVTVSDLLETASLASDARIRDPELCSFRRSIQEDLLARRQPSNAGAYLRSYRATVEPDNHSSFFHVRSTPIDDKDDSTQTTDDDDASSVSSSESGLSTDSSLAAALQAMEIVGESDSLSEEQKLRRSRRRLRRLRRQRRNSLRRRKQLAAAAAVAAAVSEPEPFVAHLPEPLRSGRRIIVSGQFSESTKRATLSLRNSKRSGISASTDNAKTRKAAADVEEEFLVQLKQLDEEGGATELTCRQYNGREWTSEQRSMTRALKPNKTGSFCVEIHTSSVAFTVRFEDAVCVQPHTIPFSNFTHLVLDGSSEYQSIEFPDELELPYSEEFPQSLDLVSHILIKLQLLKSAGATSGKRASTTVPGSQSPIAFGLDHGAAMLCLMDPVKQTVSVGRTVPETGGFLCETKVDRVPDLAKLSSVLLRMETDSVLILLDGKPVLSYTLLTRKHYITSFFIDGNFLLKDVVWKEKRAPKWTPLPPSFQVGRSIRVSGLLPEDGRSVCCVALTVDAAGAPESSNAAFCLRCEPGRQPSVTSSAPSASSATMQRPPLLPGQRFEAHILCKLTGFEVMLGDLEAGVCQVPHGVDPRQLRSVRLTGGAVFYEVDFPDQLGLPYLNRFPVSLKESRFVTVDVECGLHASRPNTISFALCTGPGDACLKPLVCEFNMAQGYASMAWSNPAGELCDEDTKKFDPRLAGEVETVALQATDSDYILSVNETAVLKYPVRHSLDEIQYVLIDGDVCITSVQFEGKAATPSCCIN